MPKLLTYLFLSTLICLGCNKLEIEKGTPRCIRKRIKELEKNSCAESSAKEYTYQNKTVYVLFFGNCPDAGSTVYDDECNPLGGLGGHAQNQIIEGDTFYKRAVFVKTIWEK